MQARGLKWWIQCTRNKLKLFDLDESTRGNGSPKNYMSIDRGNLNQHQYT